jgi:hypothetical protein
MKIDPGVAARLSNNRPIAYGTDHPVHGPGAECRYGVPEPLSSDLVWLLRYLLTVIIFWKLPSAGVNGQRFQADRLYSIGRLSASMAAPKQTM